MHLFLTILKITKRWMFIQITDIHAGKYSQLTIFISCPECSKICIFWKTDMISPCKWFCTVLKLEIQPVWPLHPLLHHSALPSALPPHPFFQVLMLARPSCQLLPEAASACGKLTCSPRPHWSPASSHLIIDSYIYLENSKINITNSGCLWEVPYLFQFICVDNAGIF